MVETLHFQLLAAHTVFQHTFLRNARVFYPELLPGQPRVIDYLMRNESAYQKEIADACLLEPPTLSVILDKMANMALIRRAKAEGNRKNSMVTLTDKGRSIGQELLRIFEETEEELCRGISDGDRKIFSAALKAVFRNGTEQQ